MNTDNPVVILGAIHLSDHVADILDGKEHTKTIPPTAITQELLEQVSSDVDLRHLKIYGRNQFLASFFETQCEDGRVNNCPADKLVDDDGKPCRFIVDVGQYFYPDLSMFPLQYLKSLFS